MDIVSITIGPFAANCHILVGQDRQAIVVDPGAEPDLIEAELASRRLTVVCYALTHGHMDHVGALAELHRRHPAPIGLHPADAAWAFTEANQWPPYYTVPVLPAPIARTWSDGQVWTDAGLTYRVLATPGHSPGGVCFHIESEGLLVSGDTLFEGAVGRTDLPGGDPAALTASLRRLAQLPRHVIVLPGHGDRTTIGDELRRNPFVREAIRLG